MEFSVQENMKHKRVTTLAMRATTFGEEQFLSVLAKAFRGKYRIEVCFIEGESTEVQSLVIGSSDEDGYPHIDESDSNA